MDPIRVPDGLKELLREFTVAVLRSQPPPEDLTLFALEYFSHKIQSRHRGGGEDQQHLLLHHHLHPHPAAPSSCQQQPSLGGGGGTGGGGTGSGGTGGHQGWVVNFVVQSASESDEDEDGEFMAPVINRFTRRASDRFTRHFWNRDQAFLQGGKPGEVVHPKSDDQRQRLQEACKHILLFKNLERDQMAEVLDAMFEKSVVTGEYIIDMDDDGDNFYVIESGTYDILKREDNGEERVVGCYDNKGSFGELALMYNTPRAATIIATSPGALWCLDRGTFRRIILKTNAKKRRMYECFIESLPLFKSLEPSERMRVADVLVSKAFSDGERIIAQGDKPDCFYIVEAGQVRITMNRNKANEPVKEVEISMCTRGEYFGELALVTNKPRAASAYTVGNVKCLVMDVLAFERLLGPCMDIMKRNIMNYEEQLARLFSNTDYKDAEQSPVL